MNPDCRTRAQIAAVAADVRRRNPADLRHGTSASYSENGLEKRSPSPRPSPPGEGEARTVPGIFTPFGVELLHGDLRRRLQSASRIFLLLLLCCCGSRLARADDVPSAFEQANKLYEQGKFTEAAAAYEKLIVSERVSPALYFNFGNALFKSGRIGRAILNYRLAEQLAPRDPDVRANLRFARNQVSGADAQSPIWWRRWIGHLTLNEWTVLAAVAVWLWFGLLALAQWRPALKKSLGGYTATVGVAAALLSVCLAVAGYDRFQVKPAIVVASEAVVRYGPLDESNRYYTVRDGAELKILDAKGDWLEVIDRFGRIGWLRREQVLLFHGASLTSSSSLSG